MRLPAGSELGPYEVLDLLGAGGMGQVYRARDPRLGRDVAVKVLPEEVLSAFPDRAVAEGVLGQLIDARFLTSYEVEGKEGEPSHHRVEVVHEWLLKAWPRLVRWQAQDEEGALLRDQVKQAAHLWEEKSRSPDLLWSGTAFREFELWRERYPGKLTSIENGFARAMVERAGRTRRRRRVGIAVVIATLVLGLGTIGSFWRQSETARQEAEASRLLALGRLELDEDPSAALAYALQSLELADDPDVRRFALEVLWRGPTRIVFSPDSVFGAWFTPDGRWFALPVGADTESDEGKLEAWPRDGGTPIVIRVPREPDSVGAAGSLDLAFGPESESLIHRRAGGSRIDILSFPEGRPIRALQFESSTTFRLARQARRLFTFTRSGKTADGFLQRVQSWSLDGDTPRQLDSFSGVEPDVDALGTWMAYGTGQDVRLRPVEGLETSPPRLVTRHERPVWSVRFHPDGRRLASLDESGEIRLASVADRSGGPVRVFRGPPMSEALAFSADGSMLASAGGSGWVGLWDLTAPPDAAPRALRLPERTGMRDPGFHPDGRWLVTNGDSTGTTFWPINRRYPHVFSGVTAARLVFAPDGRWLAATLESGRVRLWPLASDSREQARVLFEDATAAALGIDVHPAGHSLVAGFSSGEVWLLPVGEGRPRLLPGFHGQVWAVAFGPEGHRAAACGGQFDPRGAVIRVWDLESGEASVMDPGHGKFIYQIRFTRDGRLVSADAAGVRLWSLEDGSSRLLQEGTCRFALGPDDRSVYAACGPEVRTRAEIYEREGAVRVVRHDIEAGGSESLDLVLHRPESIAADLALDPTGGTLVSGDLDGIVRARALSDGAPQLLLGHAGHIRTVAVSPDGRWIASGGEDEIRLWPMPDMDQPPFHTLPYKELLARLRALTNLRAVADTASPTGYRIEPGPFPGWATVPTW